MTNFVSGKGTTISNKRGSRVFYGWWVVAGVFGLNFVTGGIGFYSFSVFLKPLIEEFGWTRAEASLGQSLSALAAGITGILVGKFIERFSINGVIAFGALVAGVGFLLLSQMSSLWHFYLLYMVTGIALGGAAGVIPGLTAVSYWFVKKRGRAIGIATIGASAGALVIASLFGYVIDHFGWRIGYLVAGSLILVIDIPIALFVVKKKPEDMGLLADNEVPSQLTEPSESFIRDDIPSSNLTQTTPFVTTSLRSYLKRPTLWFLSFGFLFANIGEMGVIVHEVSYLTDIGIAVTVAAGALGFSGAIGGFGKLFFGYLTERISVRYAIMICFTVQAIGVFILMMVNTNAALLWIFVLVFGFAFGGVITLMPLAVGALFPLSALGVILGFVHFVFISGVLIGPPLAGLAYDLSGAYIAAFTGFIGSFILAVVFIYFAWGINPKPYHGGRAGTLQAH